MKYVDDGDVVGRDAVDHQVVGVNDRLACPGDTARAIEIGVLRQSLSGLFDGPVQRLGGVGIAITEVVEDGSE